MTPVRFFCFAALLQWAASAHTAITCSVASPGFSTAYVSANATANITQTSVTVTCQRNAPNDPTTFNYGIRLSDNGLNAFGLQNRAAFGGNFIAYESYLDGVCSALWGGPAPATRISGTITLAGYLPASQTTAYWGCVPGGQTGMPAGTYTDTVTMVMSSGAVSATGTFPVSILTPADCIVTTPPGNVAFAYTALGAAANANTSFGVTCTNQLPYTMALDTATGVLVGLQYGLSLSAPAATGTGLQQTHTVNGLIPAGQAGTCAGGVCAGTQTHTLTITY